MMLRLNLQIDLSDQISKCSDAFEKSIKEGEDFQSMTKEQKSAVVNCMDQFINDYFADIKTHMIGQPE